MILFYMRQWPKQFDNGGSRNNNYIVNDRKLKRKLLETSTQSVQSKNYVVCDGKPNLQEI